MSAARAASEETLQRSVKLTVEAMTLSQGNHQYINRICKGNQNTLTFFLYGMSYTTPPVSMWNPYSSEGHNVPSFENRALSSVKWDESGDSYASEHKKEGEEEENAVPWHNHVDTVFTVLEKPLQVRKKKIEQYYTEEAQIETRENLGGGTCGPLSP
ncbi:hypothetical protein STEG23_004481, partial [Scotinomys teguina]